MLCSAPTAKSGSNWLDRLRSNKGIPTGDDLDLDSFLLNAHSHSPQARPINQARPQAHPSETHDPPMSMILAELFNTGTTLTLTSKKCPRKQTNPKFFLASSSSNTVNASASVPATATATAVTSRYAVEEVEDCGDGEDNDLKGFSKSEVTMIDTSCPVWKFDKFVFRKNNVWKVRERKPKTKFFAKKKSNGNHEIHINGIGISKDNAVNTRGEKPVKMHKVI